MPKWKTLKSKIIFKNPWFQLRHDQTLDHLGRKTTYTYLEAPPGVFIVAITPKKEIYLVRLYRYPWKKYSLEIPAGGTENQPPLKAAKREFYEETGFTASKWTKAGKFYSLSGLSNVVNYCFIAEGLNQTGSNEQKEEGITELTKVPFKKVLKMIDSGKIFDEQSIAAIFIAGRKLKLLK